MNERSEAWRGKKKKKILNGKLHAQKSWEAAVSKCLRVLFKEIWKAQN